MDYNDWREKQQSQKFYYLGRLWRDASLSPTGLLMEVEDHQLPMKSIPPPPPTGAEVAVFPQLRCHHRETPHPSISPNPSSPPPNPITPRNPSAALT